MFQKHPKEKLSKNFLLRYFKSKFSVPPSFQPPDPHFNSSCFQIKEVWPLATQGLAIFPEFNFVTVLCYTTSKIKMQVTHPVNFIHSLACLSVTKTPAISTQFVNEKPRYKFQLFFNLFGNKNTPSNPHK